MGGGTSSLQRARKIIVFRAYNTRTGEQTLKEQFEPLAKINQNDQKVVVAADIVAYLDLEQPCFEDLLQRIAGNSIGELAFDSFIEFLDSGTLVYITSTFLMTITIRSFFRLLSRRCLICRSSRVCVQPIVQSTIDHPPNIPNDGTIPSVLPPKEPLEDALQGLTTHYVLTHDETPEHSGYFQMAPFLALGFT
jgi:hypothetical protein